MNQKQTDITTGTQIRHLRTQSGNDTGRTGWEIECYPAGGIELGERC